MVANIQYTNIRRVLDNLLDHPLLKDVSLEQAVRYTLRFISLFGFPALYEDKVAKVTIDNFRGVLPCDLISIIQVKEAKHDRAMRAMSDTFIPALTHIKEERCGKTQPKCKDQTNNTVPLGMDRCPCGKPREYHEDTFKTQGRIIFTSFPEGEVLISYKAIPVDDDGFPLLIDNEVYLNALELYIKKVVFTIKFDMGKLQPGILQNVQQEYAWAAGELQNEMTTPSISEMEGITRMLNTLILPTNHFDNGFKRLGDREYIRKH